MTQTAAQTKSSILIRHIRRSAKVLVSALAAAALLSACHWGGDKGPRLAVRPVNAPAPTVILTVATTITVDPPAPTITTSVTPPTTTSVTPPAEPLSLVMNNGVVVSALNLPAPAAVQSAPAYSAAQYADNPGLGFMRASIAFERGYFGQGVTIAYIGQGVNAANPRLSANILPGMSIGVNASGVIVTGTVSGSKDDDSTGVAGLVVAAVTSTVTNTPGGAAPQARLIPLLIHDGTAQARNAITAAFSVAAQSNAEIILAPWRALAIPGSMVPVRDLYNRGSTLSLLGDVPVMPEMLSRGFAVGDYTAEYFRSFIANLDVLRDSDSIVVVPAGDGGWNSATGMLTLVSDSGNQPERASNFNSLNGFFINGQVDYIVPRTDANHPGILAEAPLLNSNLLGKWMVVVATDEDGTIREYSNGCGAALYWCIAMRDQVPISNTDGSGTHNDRTGTSFSAAQAGGALAVLRSRFPDMPMAAVAALLFRTADDLGAEGVDRVYGHGRLNLGAAITVQGNADLVIGLNSVTMLPPLVPPPPPVSATITPPTSPTTTVTTPTTLSLSVLISNGVAVSAFNVPPPPAEADLSNVAYSTLQYNHIYGTNATVLFPRAAYDRGIFGQGVTIAYIGSGVNAANPRLAPNLLPGLSIGLSVGDVLVTGTVTGHKDDDTTGVAGLMVGITANSTAPAGVAPRAKLIPLLIHNGTAQSPHVVPAALGTAVSRGAQIILMPWLPFTYAGDSARVAWEDHVLVGGSTITSIQHGNLTGETVPAMPILVTNRYSNGFHTSRYYGDFISDVGGIMRDSNAVAVVPAGDSGWNSQNGAFNLSLDNGTDLNVSANDFTRRGTFEVDRGAVSENFGFRDGESDQPGIVAEAPLYDRNLLGKWIAVVATDSGGVIRSYSNGCGAAMYWCLAAPDSLETTDTGGNGSRTDNTGTSSAAAVVAGALALLQSRFPTMPMQAVAAILLKTARDTGEAGVDSVYGHGGVRLVEAMRLQGSVDLVVGLNSVTLRTPLPSHTVTTYPSPPSVVLRNGVAVSALNLPSPARTHKLIAYSTLQYSNNEGLDFMRANVAYERGYFGQSVTIAYIGNGVAPFNFNLNVNLLPGMSIGVDSSGAIVSGTVTGQKDDTSTGVAGLIVSRVAYVITPVGVAPQAKLIPLLIHDGTTQVRNAITAAFSVAAESDAKIILAPRLAIAPNTVPVRSSHGTLTLENSLPVIPEMLNRGLLIGDHTPTYYEGFLSNLDVLRDEDVVVVVPAGDGGWNSENGGFRVGNEDRVDGVTPENFIKNNGFYITDAGDHIVPSAENQSGILAEAPLFNRNLLGKWMVVTATDADGKIRSYSNGCGAAMYWCLAMRDEVRTSDTGGTGTLTDVDSTGSLFSAAQASGALAVLRSRFPTMPMAAVAALLFKTATDLGATGVDPVYGHGRLDLGAAITVQGNVDLVVGISSVTLQTLVVPLPPPSVVVSNGLAVSALYLPAPSTVQSTGTPSSGQIAVNPWINNIGATVAFYRGYFGEGVTIAYIGNGVNPANSRVSPNLLVGLSIGVNSAGAIVTGTVTGSKDDESSGVAAMMVGDSNTHDIGVAPRAKLIPLLIHNGTSQQRDAITVALSVAVARGAKAILAPWVTPNLPRSLALIDYAPLQAARPVTTRFGAPVIPALLAAGFETGGYSAAYFRDFISNMGDLLRDKDVAVVMGAGDLGWNSETGKVLLHNLATAPTPQQIIDTSRGFLGGDGNLTPFEVEGGKIGANQPGIMAEAPLYNSDLLGKWLVVTGLNLGGTKIESYSNGCGAAMYWCLGMQAESQIANDAGTGRLLFRGDTLDAAARATGALAVLRSRFPDMPMPALVALLLKTATDLGDPGVDEVYGHGHMNLGAAITVQGDINLVVGLNSVTVRTLTAPSPLPPVSVVVSNGLAVSALHLPAPVVPGVFPYSTVQYAYNTWLHSMGASVAYAHGYFGQGVTIAYIGDGVESTAIRLRDNLLSGTGINEDSSGNIVTSGDDSPFGSHATPVAAAVASPFGGGAKPVGAAPQAKILPLRIHTANAQRGQNINVIPTAFSLAIAGTANIILAPWHAFSIPAGSASVSYADASGTRQVYNMEHGAPPMPTLMARGYSNGTHTPEYYRGFVDNLGAIMRDKNAVAVVPAGDHHLNTANETLNITRSGSPAVAITTSTYGEQVGFWGSEGDLIQLSMDMNQPGIMAEAPLYNRDLLGKWMVVVATDNNGRIRNYSNGCGSAMYWCLGTRGDVQVQNVDDDGTFSRDGTLYAAALASGALAVLSSRFPAMPMPAVAAILFQTATDRGETGVDRVYGHGELNLGAAITVQGDINLVVGLNSVTVRSLTVIPPPPPSVVISSGVVMSALHLPPPGASTNTGVPDSLQTGNNAWIGHMGIAAAFSRGFFGQSVTIAYIGNGVNPTLSQVSPNLLAGLSIGVDSAGAIVTGTATGSKDDESSGVAAMMVGPSSNTYYIGVAPQAKLIPLLIHDGTSQQRDAITVAISAAVARGAKVILAPWEAVNLPASLALVNYDPVHTGGSSTLQYGAPAMPALLTAGFESGGYSARYFHHLISDIGDLLRDKDVAVVMGAGDHAWNSESGKVRFINSGHQPSAQQFINTSRGLFDGDGELNPWQKADGSKISANQPGIMAEAPLYNSDLLGKWLVVTGLSDNGETIVQRSNGCGAAMYWCVGTRANSPIVNDVGSGGLNSRSNTLDTAARASGALAVLRSRFPSMPMPALVAILLKTAIDRGAQGVDEVYGHGQINVGAAISVQGNIDLVVGLNSITMRKPLFVPPISVVMSNGILVRALDLPAPAPAAGSVPYSNLQLIVNPGISGINASIAHDHGYFGEGVTIAYIGNGLTPHDRLMPNLLPGLSIGVGAGGAIVTGTVISSKHDQAHGAAGLMVAITVPPSSVVAIGVAPEAKLIPLLIHNGTTQQRDAITVALSAAVARGAQVVLAPWRSLVIPGSLARISEGSRSGTATLANSVPVLSDILLQGYEVGDISDDYFRGFISDMGDLVRNKDVVVVVPAGDNGWNSHNGKQTVLHASGSTVYNTSELVTSYNGFYDADGTLTRGTRMGADRPGIMGEAPLFNRDLLGKWMVVVALNGNIIENYSNGCGPAMYWCVAARSVIPIDDASGNGRLNSQRGTLLPAALASGALAVLRSRFPTMPMPAVAAILFKTADDLGDKGVDSVYGQGRINLGKAITVQGDVDLVVGLNSVTVQTLTASGTGEEKSPAQSTGAGDGIDADIADADDTANAGNAANIGTAAAGLRLLGLSDTRLGTGFGKMRKRLHALPMAVSYLGGAFYYENALSDITDFHGEELTSLGNAAADMFGASQRIRTAQGLSAVADQRSGRIVRAGIVRDTWRVGYDICTECDEESWRMESAGDHAGGTMGKAFFAANEQGAGATWSPAAINPALDGVEFFSAVGLGEDAKESTYQQYGLRWRGDVPALSNLAGLSGFSLLAEWSHIEEEDSLLGSYGDVLGVDSASSRQARLELQGALPGALSNWRLHGGYTQGWSDADLNGMGLITEMSGLRYAHWHIESSARNLLQGSDELRIGLSGAPRITGDVHFKHYRAGEEVFVQDLQYALPNTVREERFTMHELSDNALIWRLGYKWRVMERQGIMDAALGWEAISGSGASAGDHAASFQLRWTY